MKYAPKLLVALLFAFVGVLFSSSSAMAAEVDGVEPGVSDSVARLYLSVFDREADQDGFEYWVDNYTNGLSLDQIAELFIESSEWNETYGELNNADYVTVLYQNVLDRNPDDAGFAYWVGELNAGLSRSRLVTYFSESPEFIEATGTAEPVAPTVAVPADSGTGRRIIYSNTDQRVWLVNEFGTVDDTYLVSGRKDTPLAGTYSVFSKSEKAWAGHDGITMNHMVRFAWGRTLAIGFHSIPTYADGTPMQTEDELGTYQSAGCVRQSEHKAEALYHWADVGTVVVVLP